MDKIKKTRKKSVQLMKRIRSRSNNSKVIHGSLDAK